jgi:hypothetical protein
MESYPLASAASSSLTTHAAFIRLHKNVKSASTSTRPYQTFYSIVSDRAPATSFLNAVDSQEQRRGECDRPLSGTVASGPSPSPLFSLHMYCSRSLGVRSIAPLVSLTFSFAHAPYLIQAHRISITGSAFSCHITTPLNAHILHVFDQAGHPFPFRPPSPPSPPLVPYSTSPLAFPSRLSNFPDYYHRTRTFPGLSISVCIPPHVNPRCSIDPR